MLEEYRSRKLGLTCAYLCWFVADCTRTLLVTSNYHFPFPLTLCLVGEKPDHE